MDLERPRRILLLGDSITQQGFSAAHSGWAAQLADHYARRADVVCRGFSGYNSRWLLQRWPAVAASCAPGFDLATILLGANDSARNGQHVPLPEYEANLAALVAALRQDLRCDRVVVIAPPPCDGAAWAEGKGEDPATCTMQRTDEFQREYGAAARRVAEASDGAVTFLDSRAVIIAATGGCGEAGLRDGLHLNAAGNTALFAALAAHVAAHHPCLAVPEEGAMFLPHYSALLDT